MGLVNGTNARLPNTILAVIVCSQIKSAKKCIGSVLGHRTAMRGPLMRGPLIWCDNCTREVSSGDDEYLQ